MPCWAFVEAAHLAMRHKETCRRFHQRKWTQHNKTVATKGLCKNEKFILILGASALRADEMEIRRRLSGAKRPSEQGHLNRRIWEAKLRFVAVPT
jgi:hypothetical protein